jgi:hypothetical protein
MKIHKSSTKHGLIWEVLTLRRPRISVEKSQERFQKGDFQTVVEKFGLQNDSLTAWPQGRVGRREKNIFPLGRLKWIIIR